jgi:hypothetical protein
MPAARLTMSVSLKTSQHCCKVSPGIVAADEP